jgi:hypothetical protein
MPADVMVQLIATVYFIKLATEVIVSPLTVKIITLIKRSENVDVYEAPSLSLNR